MLPIKKLILLSGTVFVASFTSVSFAAVEPVECSTSTVFGDNECGVCYRESTAVTGTGTALEITGVKMPWKNTQTGISEVAFEIDNDVPKIISEHKIVTDPVVLDDLWKFTNPWTGIGEYALASGKETTLTELVPDGSIEIYGKGDTLSPTVLIKSELNYVDREVAKLKESESKTRNICLLYNLTFSANNLNSGNTTTPAANTTPTNTTPTANGTTNPTTSPATPTTNTSTSTTVASSTTATPPTTPVAPIPRPTPTTVPPTNTTTNTPATNTATPSPTNTANTVSTNTTTTTNTPSTTTPPVTATTQTNNTVINPQTTTPPSATTNTTVQSYTSPNIPLNSAADPTTIAASKVPTGPAENMMLFLTALFLSALIYWKKQKNSV